MPTASRPPRSEVPDLVLIPCQPSVFDLRAIQTTASPCSCCASPPLLFLAGNPNAPRVHQEAGELVDGFGTSPYPVQIPDRGACADAGRPGRAGHPATTDTGPASRQGRKQVTGFFSP